jgi:hypothetical protein
MGKTRGGAGAPAPLIILISLTNPRRKKSFALPGQALFKTPETPFRNMATPPLEGTPVVLASRPTPVVKRPAPLSEGRGKGLRQQGAPFDNP